MGLILALALLGQLLPASPPDSLLKPQAPFNVERVSLRRALSDSGRCGQPDRWFAMDKFWHFSASFVTVGATYHLGEDRVGLSPPWATGLAMGGTLTLGVSKEFFDLAGPEKHFSWKDLAADAVGVCAGYFAFIHRF